MRDPNRIYPFCMKLAELWSNYPDLRFGQMMINIEKWCRVALGKEPFYMEEDELMEVISQQLRTE